MSESIQGEAMEEDITIRNNKAVRQRRLNMVRTPTAVVSEVFDFLNEVPSDDNDELIMSDGEVDQLFANLDMSAADYDATTIEDCVHGNLLFNGSDGEKLLAEFRSKDSGFASLERQRCEPSSLHDSYLENEDDTEDAVESVCSNDIIGSISESLYDDVDVSSVPRSVSMDGRATCVDDETENAIASSAEQFSVESRVCDSGSEPPLAGGLEAVNEDAPHKLPAASKMGANITVIIVKKPPVEQTDVCENTQEIPPAKLETDAKTSTSEDSSDVLKEYTKTLEDNSSVAVINDSVVVSQESQELEAGNMFHFAIEPGNESPDSALMNNRIMDSYCTGTDGVASGGLFDFDGLTSVAAAAEIYDVAEGAESNGNDNDIVSATGVCSTSSDDGEDEDEDVRDSDCTAIVCDQAYDTIDVEPHENFVCDQLVLNDEEDLGCCGGHEADDSSVNSQQATTPLSEKSPSSVSKRHKLEKNPSAEMASDDSSDEDVGIYAESFRRSNWVRLSQAGRLEVKIPDSPSSQSSTSSGPLLLATDSIGSSNTDNTEADDVFNETPSQTKMAHKRTDSITTTASESEFKFQYVSRRKCLIQRADSQQEYHRLSSRVYDQDKQVTIHRTSDSEDLGLHLLGSHPAFITSIDPGSVADKAGLTEGQILVSVNDQNVLTTDHSVIVELIHNSKGDIKMGVANSDFQPVRDLQATIMSGYMYKLGNSAFKMWNKRYFILRQDNCLYYYKNEHEHDPLGALPLGGYTISRHTETSKDFCFKAEKYGGRTYYFIADNRDQMTEWVGALTEAAARSKKRKESFLSVSSHNVGLPALHILKPECAGFLGKLDPSKRVWRRRYCVLKDACMYYYKDKNSVSALGVAHLHGYTVDVENYQRRKFSFTLQPPEKKMRIFYFSADNETDKKRWVESLIHSIQRWVRVDKEVEC